MTTITRHDIEIEISGNLPPVGTNAPSFSLAATDLADVSLNDFIGKKVLLNIFPSIDTPTCAKSVRAFNEQAASMDNTIVLCISPDLPYAHKRFCEVENIDNVVALSTFRNPEFGRDYGVTMISTQRRGLLARAVVVIDGKGKVIYTELVPELTQEPDYQAALRSL
ncbi:MAG: thiol peroxidase [Desulfofustis sp.]|nr:thiol peroxidase [Desulfofustis sp.]NNF45170.1 thiol peroxidase [Desulfofustis sp.]NNK14044.1 thiol peroxidase [Desulfofustis sp.]NNK58461.1 thiol peroxidase [Desulfofustis sp.]